MNYSYEIKTFPHLIIVEYLDNQKNDAWNVNHLLSQPFIFMDESNSFHRAQDWLQAHHPELLL